MNEPRKRRTIIVGGKGQRIAGRHFISNMTINVGGGVNINGTGDHSGGIHGSGRQARTPRELPAFDRIIIASGVDLEVTFGSVQKVEVEADDNLVDLVETTVQSALGSTLYIDVRESLSTENALVVHAQLPVPLHSLTINGSGDAYVQDLQQDAISLRPEVTQAARHGGRVAGARIRRHRGRSDERRVGRRHGLGRHHHPGYATGAKHARDGKRRHRIRLSRRICRQVCCSRISDRVRVPSPPRIAMSLQLNEVSSGAGALPESACVTDDVQGMTYAKASKQLAKVGTAHAEGDALRAMYAQLLASRMRGADPARFYAYLAHNEDLIGRYRKLCDDVWAYTDALLTSP
jgi:hypothetical protein